MAKTKGVTCLVTHDCPGGGQVVVEGSYAYIGHMRAPFGTSIVDVSDPKAPREVASIPLATGFHSHKVRVANDLMLVNREVTDFEEAAKSDTGPGLTIYDVSDPATPKQITHWSCSGKGVHRFTFDGRYAYLSPEMEGYVGNIVLILDLADPARPVEVGRWWMPGQWIAGGEEPTWSGRNHRCHHPIRMGDRLYVSYWYGGFVILDIADMTDPKLVSAMDWSPPFPWPTHSTVPVPFSIAGHKWMLVADEDVFPLDPDLAPDMAAFLWMVDITDETRPIPVGSFQVDGVQGHKNPMMTGCHQPIEDIRGTEVPVAWFANGVRFIDISNPHCLRETAYFVPDPAAGEDRPCSNDVFVDERGLIYAIDRVGGLSILERT